MSGSSHETSWLRYNISKEIFYPNFNWVSATSKLLTFNNFNPFQPLAFSLRKSSQLVKKSLENPLHMKVRPQCLGGEGGLLFFQSHPKGHSSHNLLATVRSLVYPKHRSKSSTCFVFQRTAMVTQRWFTHKNR